MTSLAATYGFTADKGATFSQQIKWKDATRTPINLIGYTAVMVIRQKTTNPTVVLTLTTENGGITLGGVEGTIRIDISADQTDGISAGPYTYTLEVTSSDSEVTRLLMGTFIVRPEFLG